MIGEESSQAVLEHPPVKEAVETCPRPRDGRFPVLTPHLPPTKKLSVTTVRRIADLPQRDWEEVYPNVLESYSFFKTLDESRFDGFFLYYILIRDHDVPVGAASCFVMSYGLDTTWEGPLKGLSQTVKRFLPGFLSMKILVCGSPTGQGRIGVRSTRHTQHNEVMNVMVKAMETIADQEKASILAFKDFSCDYSQPLESLAKEGFYRMESYPAVDLHIWFKNFEDHIKSLSRVTRKGLNRKFRSLENLSSIDFEVRDDLNGCLDEAHALYLQTFQKSQVQFEKPPKEFFERMAANMRGKAKYFLWRVAGKLVAFEACLVSRDVLIDLYIGMDYPTAYRYHLYYVTFRDMIHWCIQNGVQRYESGALNYDPKKRLGMRFIPLYIYVKHRNRYVQPALRLVSRFIKPANFDKVLKQLKEEGRL